MPTNRIKRTRGQSGLDYWKLTQLIDGSQCLTAAPGYGYCPEGVTGGCNHWTNAQWMEWTELIRADWQKHGQAVLAWWRGETESFTAIYASVGGRRREASRTPWALTEFGEPQ